MQASAQAIEIKMPRHFQFPEHEWNLRCELAAAYRLVADFGWSDQSGGQKLRSLPQSVTKASLEGAKTLLADSGFAPQGQKEWRALLRRLDRTAPDYRQ